MSILSVANVHFESTGSNRIDYLPANGSLAISTNSAEHVRIDSNGNIGVGTTSASYKLDVNGTINASSVLVNGAPLGGGGSIGIVDESAANASYYPILSTQTSGNLSSANVSTTKLYFTPNTGTLSATIFNSLSDANHKTDIQPITNPLELTTELRGVWFKWVDTGAPSMGLIAQEVEKTLPQLVTENNGVKTLNYDALIGLLIEDIKELKVKVEKLENNG